MQRAGKGGESEAKRLASRLADAGFVALRCRADGDALAATGVLAQALGAIETPFQATVHPLGSERKATTDADLVVRIGLAGEVGEPGRGGSTDADDSTGADGTDDTISLPGEPTPASLGAVGVARELGVDPDPVLALAGGVAAAVRDARDPFGDGAAVRDAAESDDRVESGGDGEEERVPAVPTLDALADRARDDGRLGDHIPGIALSTTDVVDGLAHTTLSHTAFSGDREAARERCGSLAEADNGREIASLLACSVVSTENASPRAVRAVKRALCPTSLPDSSTPFATLEGYADVLGAVATERPGIGLALACGYDVGDAALSAWRTHARRAHAALRSTTIARYDGLCVARLADDPATDTDESGYSDRDETIRPPVATVARLLRDFRSPEPIALVVGDGIGAITATDDHGLGRVVARAARAFDGTGGGSERLGECRFDASTEEFVTAVRAELADESRSTRGDGGTPRSAPSRKEGDLP